MPRNIEDRFLYFYFSTLHGLPLTNSFSLTIRQCYFSPSVSLMFSDDASSLHFILGIILVCSRRFSIALEFCSEEYHSIFTTSKSASRLPQKAYWNLRLPPSIYAWRPCFTILWFLYAVFQISLSSLVMPRSLSLHCFYTSFHDRSFPWIKISDIGIIFDDLLIYRLRPILHISEGVIQLFLRLLRLCYISLRRLLSALHSTLVSYIICLTFSSCNRRHFHFIYWFIKNWMKSISFAYYFQAFDFFRLISYRLTKNISKISYSAHLDIFSFDDQRTIVYPSGWVFDNTHIVLREALLSLSAFHASRLSRDVAQTTINSCHVVLGNNNRRIWYLFVVSIFSFPRLPLFYYSLLASDDICLGNAMSSPFHTSLRDDAMLLKDSCRLINIRLPLDEVAFHALTGFYISRHRISSHF